MDSYMHSDMHLHTHSRPDTLPRRSELYHIHPTSQRNPIPVQLPLTSTPQSAPTRSPTTCMPSALLDPGMDPSGVDFRNFFPYIPNEVKHRKRTSTEQAKVLEGIFTKNPKPDSKLRGRLAEELDMKPRGVQAQAASAQAERKAEKKKSPAVKEEPSTQPSSPPDNYSSPSSSRQDSSSPESSPGPLTLDVPLPEIVSAPPAHDLSPKVVTPAIRQLDPPRAAPDLYSLRRGSLPNLIGSQTSLSRSSMGPPRPVVNQLGRRGSVERLRRNPYAAYVHTRPRPAPYRNRQTSLRESFPEVQGTTFEDASRDAALAEARDQHSALLAPGPSRRMLTHRASMPHVLTGVDMTRRASMPANMLSGPSFASSTPGIDRHGFVQSRMVAEPIPGPLPSPGYSFGGSPPDFAGFSFGENADTEDESTSVGSYDPWSRIGSIASTSSSTSACYSEVDSPPEIPAPHGWNPEARRESL
ncbi:hypothetical protein FIBSPDRAFT_1134 [Athelia psychrophila]|uniref:Homeobox domain-containing protein n=1 Tax=Athelia psychrophila TaxID=1759441 RepID=A0A166WWN2_9AGAM|nr:hypothetical protein FIBSPDRAFT_1134 [Fibularhizoctonia sp. CBS 109695]